MRDISPVAKNQHVTLLFTNHDNLADKRMHYDDELHYWMFKMTKGEDLA